MALGGPSIYPSSGVWLGISRELFADAAPDPIVTAAADLEPAGPESGELQQPE